MDSLAWSPWSGTTSVAAPVRVPWRRHVLYVEARTPLGARTAQPARLQFDVPPPVWWRREVLLPLAVLLVTLAGATLLLLRRRRQNRALARRVRVAERMEVVGSFAAGMAHELNNLLATVVLNTDLVVDESNTDPTHSPTADIRRAALQAAGQVRSLQAFTRDQLMLLRPVDLRAELRRQRDTLHSLLAANVASTWDLGSEPLPVRAEANGLSGILHALVENAQDAMPDGGKFHLALFESTLSHARRRQLGLSADVRYAEITISDDGAGMTREVSQRAFEPYFSTRDQPGLGLSLVYGLTHRFGGAVELDSVPGRGTTVRLFFPTVKGEPGQA